MARWAARHPHAVDGVFAAIVGLATLLGHLGARVDGSERTWSMFSVALIVAEVVAFAFRRRVPIPSFLAVCGLTVLFWIGDYATNFDIFSLLAVYSATAHGGPNRAFVWRVVGVAVATMSAIAVIGVISPTEDLPAAAVIGIAALHITAAITGEIVYGRRERITELENRAVRAETERTLLARQAVLDERARIARDLHDVVAHGMSVMVVQAGAAERIVATNPDDAAEALGHIQAVGREALTEMRRMLDVLRDERTDAIGLTPQPTLADLDQIVQHCIDAGVATALSVDGDSTLSHSVGQEMALYRIAQEAMTNVIKHAGRPADAIVKVSYEPQQIRLEVLDNGVGTTERELATSFGHGFVGMRERVDLYQGTLRYGPRPGGGFRVAATLPIEESRVETSEQQAVS